MKFRIIFLSDNKNHKVIPISFMESDLSEEEKKQAVNTAINNYYFHKFCRIVKDADEFENQFYEFVKEIDIYLSTDELEIELPNYVESCNDLKHDMLAYAVIIKDGTYLNVINLFASEYEAMLLTKVINRELKNQGSGRKCFYKRLINAAYDSVEQ